MKNSSSHLNRVFWVDLIRVVSVFLVIVVHAGDYALGYWGKFPFRNGAILSWWISAAAWNSLARTGVPLLFMASGYLLLQTSDDIAVFFKKRFVKVFVPLMAWSVFYIWWKGFYAGVPSLLDGFYFTFQYFVTGPVYYTLWFLYVLIGLYLIAPIFRPLARSVTSRESGYILLLWGMTMTLSLIARISGWGITLFVQPYITGYLGYFLAGYILGQSNPPRWSIYVSALGIVVIVTGMCTWMYLEVTVGKGDNKFIFDYLSLHISALSVACFILLKNVGLVLADKSPIKLQTVVSYLAKLTFGIYLVHDIFLYVLANRWLGVKINAMTGSPFVGIPLMVSATFVLSLVLVILLQQIPLVQRVVPS
jgi:surface polysaccharide O-acyltransferase-like enzyme